MTPVDLSPHTTDCVAVVLFMRVSTTQLMFPNIVAIEEVNEAKFRSSVQRSSTSKISPDYTTSKRKTSSKCKEQVSVTVVPNLILRYN